MGLVSATSSCNKSHRVNWQLVHADSRRDQSHRVNWPFLLQNLVAGTKFSPRDWLDFVAKMASSHDATSLCDLLQGLVAGTSPFVCTDLKMSQCQVQKSLYSFDFARMKTSLVYVFVYNSN